MTDPRLDRLQEFDERSRAYPVRELLTTEQQRKPRSYTWRLAERLDQGSEGACVGFAWAHEAAARPAVIRGLAEADAREVYRRAQQLDAWPGENYSGTSVIAGAKACQERGWLTEYRWAFGIDDLELAVGYKGPAVLGLDWHAGMLRPDANGRIHPSGPVVGGHAIVCVGVNVKHQTFRLVNSWGAGWGFVGSCYILREDLARLLDADGEACVPVVRKRPG